MLAVRNGGKFCPCCGQATLFRGRTPNASSTVGLSPHRGDSLTIHPAALAQKSLWRGARCLQRICAHLANLGFFLVRGWEVRG